MVKFTEKFIEGNAEYNIVTKRLYVGNIVTSPIVEYWSDGNYQYSKSSNGNVYITVHPTHTRC